MGNPLIEQFGSGIGGQANEPAPNPLLQEFGTGIDSALAFGQPVPVKAEANTFEDKAIQFLFNTTKEEFGSRLNEIETVARAKGEDPFQAILENYNTSIFNSIKGAPSGFYHAAKALYEGIKDPRIIAGGISNAASEFYQSVSEPFVEHGILGGVARLPLTLAKVFGGMAYEMSIAPVVRMGAKGYVATPEEAKLEGQLFGANLTGMAISVGIASKLANTAKLGTNRVLAAKMASAKTPQELYEFVMNSTDDVLKKSVLDQLSKPELLRTLARSSIDGVGGGGIQGLMSGQTPEESWKQAANFAAAGVLFGSLMEGGRYAKARGIKSFGEMYVAHKMLEANKKAAGRLKADQQYTLFDYLDQGGLLDKAFALALKDGEYTLLTDVDKITAEVLSGPEAYGLKSPPTIDLAGSGGRFEVIDGGSKLKGDDGRVVDVRYVNNLDLGAVEVAVTEAYLIKALNGELTGIKNSLNDNVYKVTPDPNKPDTYNVSVYDPLSDTWELLKETKRDANNNMVTKEVETTKVADKIENDYMLGIMRPAEFLGLDSDGGIKVKLFEFPINNFNKSTDIPIARVVHKKGKTNKVLLGRNLNIGDDARRMFEATGFLPNQLVTVGGKEYIYRGPDVELKPKMVGDDTVTLEDGTKTPFITKVDRALDSNVLYFDKQTFDNWKFSLEREISEGRATSWKHRVANLHGDDNGLPALQISLISEITNPAPGQFPGTHTEAYPGIVSQKPKPGMIAVKVTTPEAFAGSQTGIKHGTNKNPFEVLGRVKELNLVREAPQELHKGKVTVEELPSKGMGDKKGKSKQVGLGKVKSNPGELRLWEGFDRTPPELAGTKAIDEDGTPARYYHGSPRGYVDPDFSKSTSNLFTNPGEAYYTTTDPTVAAGYAGGGPGYLPTGNQVRPMKLLVKNPFDVGDWTDPKRAFKYTAREANDIVKKAWILAKGKVETVFNKYKKELTSVYDEHGNVIDTNDIFVKSILDDIDENRINKNEFGDKDLDTPSTRGEIILQTLMEMHNPIIDNIHEMLGELNVPFDIQKKVLDEIFHFATDDGIHYWHVSEFLKAQGYDGIIHQGGIRAGSGRKQHNVVIVFDPEQIKSPWIQDLVEYESVKRGEVKQLNDQAIEEAYKFLPDDDKAYVEILKAKDRAKVEAEIDDLAEMAAASNHTFEVGVGGRIYLKDLATGERVRNADGKLAMETIEDARAMLESRGLSVDADKLMVDVDASLGYSPVRSVPRTGTDTNILTPREANWREKVRAGGILTSRWIMQPREVASALQIKYKLPMMDFWAKVSKAHIQYQNRVGTDLQWYHSLVKKYLDAPVERRKLMYYAAQARTPLELAAKLTKFELEFGDHLSEVMKTIDPDDLAEGFAKSVKLSRLMVDDPKAAKKFFETEEMFEKYPELQEVASLLETARSEKASALSIGKAHRYTLAKLSNAIGQDEFFKRNNFTPKEIEAVRRMEQVYNVLAAQYGIDPDILLDGYLPHLRKFDPSALTAELKYKRDKPINEDFFADLTRTGETNPIELVDDPFVLGEQYIRMYHRARELNPVINEATNTLNTAFENMKIGLSRQLDSDANKVRTVRDQMKAVVEDITSGAYGATHALDSEIMHSFTKWLDTLTNGRIKMNETHDIITAWTKMAEFNAQGFKIAAGIRDLTSTIQFYTMRHGTNRTVKMLRMIPLAAKQASLFESLGIQPSLSRTRLDVSDAAETSVKVKLNVNKAADQLGHLGFQASLQPQVYRATFAAAYLESRSTALGAIKDYIKHRNTDKLAKALDLHELGTAEVNTFIEKINAGRISDALDFYARTNAEEMVGIFGALNSPHLARHNSFGRAFMQYGVWPLWWSASISRAFARKSALGIGKTLTYAGILAYATDKVAEETGFNLDSWKLFGIYRPDLNDNDEPDTPIGLPIVPMPIAGYVSEMGGPVVQTMYNMGKIVQGSGTENEYLQNQKEQAMSQMARSLDPTDPSLNVFYPKPLPMAYAFDIFKRYADGQPMHILAGRLMGIAPNSEEYPKPE